MSDPRSRLPGQFWRRCRASRPASGGGTQPANASNTTLWQAPTVDQCARAYRDLACRALVSNLFLRLEKEHVASGEDNIVPPFRRRDQAVEEPVGRFRSLKTYIELQRFPGLRTLGVNGRSLLQCRRDAERIPGAVGKVAGAIGFDDVLGGHAGKRRHLPRARAAAAPEAVDRTRARFRHRYQSTLPHLRLMALFLLQQSGCRWQVLPVYQNPSLNSYLASSARRQ
jgi:hypothetical protein